MSYDPGVAVSVSDWALQNLGQSYIKIALRLDGHRAGEAAARKELRPLVEKAAREYGKEVGDKIPVEDVTGALDMSVKAYLEHKDDDYGGPRLERLARKPNPAGDRFYVIERDDEWYVADSKNDVRTSGAYTESEAHRMADEYNRKGTKIRVENPGSVREGQIISENDYREENSMGDEVRVENPLDEERFVRDLAKSIRGGSPSSAKVHGWVRKYQRNLAERVADYGGNDQASEKLRLNIRLWEASLAAAKVKNPTGRTGSDRLVPGRWCRVSHKARRYAGQDVQFVEFKDTPEGEEYALVQPEGGPAFMVHPSLLIELHGGRMENPGEYLIQVFGKGYLAGGGMSASGIKDHYTQDPREAMRVTLEKAKSLQRKHAGAFAAISVEQALRAGTTRVGNPASAVVRDVMHQLIHAGIDRTSVAFVAWDEDTLKVSKNLRGCLIKYNRGMDLYDVTPYDATSIGSRSPLMSRAGVGDPGSGAIWGDTVEDVGVEELREVVERMLRVGNPEENPTGSWFYFTSEDKEHQENAQWMTVREAIAHAHQAADHVGKGIEVWKGQGAAAKYMRTVWPASTEAKQALYEERMGNPSWGDPVLHSLPVGGEVDDLIVAMNENNSRHSTPYAGYEITESRKKYHLLNSVLTNGQRSGVFLIDKGTHDVYQSAAYGKAGRKIGTVARLLAQYQGANQTLTGPRGVPARPERPREVPVWGTMRHSGAINPSSGGCYVMTYGGGRYTSVAWYATREEAQSHVDRLKAAGSWSGKPPKVEASREGNPDWMRHRALTGEDPLDVAFEAGKQWGETGAGESGVANARVRHYGFMQWYNNQAPGHLIREGPPRRKLTKIQVEKSFNDGYKRGKGKAAYFYKQNEWLRQTQGRRFNPADGAAALYEEFHGVPSEQETIITEDVQYHGNLAGLGHLVEIVVKTLSGYKAVLDFEGCDVLLCSSEDGKQLYLRGGDQSLDLAAIHMNGDEWVRDSMVIGSITHLTYRTAKQFDKLKKLDYEHRLGEESGVKPELIYDVLNNALSISGGQYETQDVGIVN